MRVSGHIGASGVSSSPGYGDDGQCFDPEGLDATAKAGAVIVQPLGLRRGIGAVHCGAVVVPELGDAIDRDLGGRNVGPGALSLDMVLHIAAQPWHRMRQGRMDLDPMAHELLVAQLGPAGQQGKALDHVGPRISAIAAKNAPAPFWRRLPWRLRPPGGGPPGAPPASSPPPSTRSATFFCGSERLSYKACKAGTSRFIPSACVSVNCCACFSPSTAFWVCGAWRISASASCAFLRMTSANALNCGSCCGVIFSCFFRSATWRSVSLPPACGAAGAPRLPGPACANCSTAPPLACADTTPGGSISSAPATPISAPCRAACLIASTMCPPFPRSRSRTYA